MFHTRPATMPITMPVLRRDLARYTGLPEVAEFAHRLPRTGSCPT